MKTYQGIITKKEFVSELKKHQKAERSVIVVRDALVSRGWTVTLPNDVSANGPDLVAIKGSHGLKIEVKSAFFSKRAWKCQKTKRVSDDFIAIVFPNSEIHFEPMEDHLAKCSKDGTRSFTRLARILL